MQKGDHVNLVYSTDDRNVLRVTDKRPEIGVSTSETGLEAVGGVVGGVVGPVFWRIEPFYIMLDHQPKVINFALRWDIRSKERYETMFEHIV